MDLFSHLGKVWGLPYEWDFLEDILGAVQKESVGGLLYLKAVFSRLVYDFFEQGAGGDAYLDSFRGFYRQRAVLDYLEGHLSAGLRIQELADAMDMPVHQLSRSFQQDTKMGLKEYMVPAAGPEGQADAGTYGYAGVGGGGNAGIYRSILFFAFF